MRSLGSYDGLEELFGDFVKCNLCTHIYREGNQVTDALASFRTDIYAYTGSPQFQIL